MVINIKTYISQIIAFFLILSSITNPISPIGISLLLLEVGTDLAVKFVAIFVAMVLMVSLCTISSRAMRKINGRIITIIIIAVDNC